MPSPSGGGNKPIRYIDVYRDSECTDLFMSVPVIFTGYSSIDAGPTTVTIGDKTYKYFDGYGMRIRDIESIQANAPFLTSRNNVPAATTMYCKNGLALTIQISTTLGQTSNLHVGSQIISSGQNGGATAENPSRCYCMGIEYNNTRYIGFTQWAQGVFGSVIIPTFFAEEAFWRDALKPPYSYGEGDDINGGQGLGPGVFRRTGVTDTNPPAGLIPAGASGRGLHTYLISASNYGDLQNYLWGDASTLAKSLWQKFQNKTHSPVSCIVAVYTLPADFMPSAGIATNIRIAGVTLPISAYSADLGFAVHSFEFAPIDQPYHNFADFSHVTCKLYVPFCGEIPIPVEAAYNRTVGVRYWVDQFNGNLVARVYCGDINIGELSSNVAYRIPIVGGDDGSLDRIGAAMTGIAQITAGNYAGALGSLAEELTAPYVTQLVNADFSGSMSACTFRRPYIEWTANNDYYSNEFFKTRGVPARYGATLSSFSGGYLECETKVQSVDIPSATDNERREIENILRGGIYA